MRPEARNRVWAKATIRPEAIPFVAIPTIPLH